MAFQYQDFIFSDFSGGITDKYLGVPSNEARVLDNFVINEKGRPETRAGFELYYNSQTKTRVNGLVNFNDTLVYARYDGGEKSLRYIDDDNLATVNKVITPNIPIRFFDSIAEDSMLSTDSWQDHLLVTNRGDDEGVGDKYNYPMAVYRDELNVLKGHLLGVPNFPYPGEPDPSIAYTGDSGTSGNTYRYAIYFTQEYEVLSENQLGVQATSKFRYVGKPFFITTEEKTTEIGGVGMTVDITLPSIPVEPEPHTSNLYDKTKMSIEIFRTQSNGSTYFYVDKVALGTALYVDNITDATIAGNAVSYLTDGTVIDHQQPPRCKYLTVVNNTGYYAACVDITDGEYKPRRFFQSIPGVPSATNAFLFEDTEDDITGIGQVNGFPIVFTKSYIYRVEGGIDSLGSGSIRLRVISDVVGCVSDSSIINAGKNLYFAGINGFYVTDGYNIEMLTPRLSESYSALVRGGNGYHITAAYDRKLERVYWGCRESGPPEVTPPATEPTVAQLRAMTNDVMWVFNIKTVGFTKFRQKGMTPSAMAFREKYIYDAVDSRLIYTSSIYRGDGNGYIFIHDDIYSSDLISDSTSLPADWPIAHIPFKLVTFATDFGNPAVRKWVNTTTVTAKSSRRFAYKPTSINDDSFKEADMAPIRQMSTAAWQDLDFLWRDPSIIWRVKNTIAKQRRFPRKHMRCWRKQVGIEPVRVVLLESADFNPATITSVVPNSNEFFATLSATNRWPIDIEGRTIALDHDGHTRDFKITTRDNDQVIRFTGTAGVEGVDRSWKIAGFNKQQRFEVQSISVKFAPLSREGDKFQSEESGRE